MDPSIKNKLKNAPFVIDWDNGEKYYQIHIFESPDGSSFLQISSKTNKDGKIEVYSRGSKEGFPLTAAVAKPSTKKDFEEMTNFLKTNLEKAGFSHRFIDLSQCSDPAEATNLLTKSDPRFKVEIRHKLDI